MSVVMGPAACKTCRTSLFLVNDSPMTWRVHWYEGRSRQSYRHTAVRCRVARERAA